jgi:hypothetical protein
MEAADGVVTAAVAFSQSYWQDRKLLLREPVMTGFCSSAACSIA